VDRNREQNRLRADSPKAQTLSRIRRRRREFISTCELPQTCLFPRAVSTSFRGPLRAAELLGGFSGRL
jgi:hypothetical protein